MKCVLKREKQDFRIEIRCELANLELESTVLGSEVDYGKIGGYKRVFQKVKTHHIIRYLSVSNKMRLDLFA